jgi:diguanylate cyclase (GGDEF)-like protein
MYRTKSKTLSVQDELSGLMNRPCFMKRAAEEVARCRRTGSKLSLLLIDIDNLKQVNDVHGHAVGDVLIRDIARLLKTEIRQYDILARIEGEEFAILMPGVKGEEAENIAERLRTYVLYKRLCEVNDHAVTISIGVTEHCQEEPWIEISMARAEKALLQAKKQREGSCCQPFPDP